MGLNDDLAKAVGCLSLNYPQFVSKEISGLVDTIMSSSKAITDPLSAIGDISLQSLLDKVASISEGDVYGNMAEAIGGLAASAAQSEASAFLNVMQSAYPGTTKQLLKAVNVGEKIYTSAAMALALISEAPYIAIQCICETLSKLVTLKIKNLDALRTNVTQLNNVLATILSNSNTLSVDVMAQLDSIQANLAIVKRELERSRKTTTGTNFLFDANAFARAQAALQVVSNILAPSRTAESILGVPEVLAFGSLSGAMSGSSNLQMSLMVIRPLLQVVRIEVQAVVDQTTVINYHLKLLGAAVQNFRSAPVAGKVKELRDRLIQQLIERTVDLRNCVLSAKASGSVRKASYEMFIWASRVKAMLATMEQVKATKYTEGSMEGDSKAAALDAAFRKLQTDLQAINSAHTVAAVEDIAELKAKVMNVVAGIERMMNVFDVNIPSANDIASVRAQAYQVATRANSLIDQSIADAHRLQQACLTFAAVKIGARADYDKMLGALGDLGFDRAKDLLRTGDFASFFASGLDMLSYSGALIECLGRTIGLLDDTQSQAQLAAIRDDLVAQKSSESLRMVDWTQRRLRFVQKAEDEIANLQKNAKTVEGIYEQIKLIAKQVQVDVVAIEAGAGALSSNVDHLMVGMSGRLRDGFEQLTRSPTAGSAV